MNILDLTWPAAAQAVRRATDAELRAAVGTLLDFGREHPAAYDLAVRPVLRLVVREQLRRYAITHSHT